MDLKINLGCGEDVRDGYLNIDIFPKHPIVKQLDFRNLDKLVANNSAEEILAINIINYIRYTDFNQVLHHWITKLSPKGKIYIQSADFDLLSNQINYGRLDLAQINNYIFGNPNPENLYHFSIYNLINIVELLESLGMEVNEKGYSGTEFFVSATKRSS